MFRGHYEHSIDSKGRVSIPSKFRDVINEKHEGKVMVTKLSQSLVAYPMSEWLEIEEKLRKAPKFEPEVQRFKRFFISPAVECLIDQQGRILIPANLRNFAKIDKELIFVGQLDNFEIWSKELWDKEDEVNKNSFLEDSKTLSKYGI